MGQGRASLGRRFQGMEGEVERAVQKDTVQEKQQSREGKKKTGQGKEGLK